MDEDASLLELCLPRDILSPLFTASNLSSLEEALENLIEASRTDVGRKDLASKNILPTVLQLAHSLPYPSGHHLLISSLKLIRNLCAGEVANQDVFIERNGVGVVSNVLRSAAALSHQGYGIVRMGLQVLANASLAGEEHQRAIWLVSFRRSLLLLRESEAGRLVILCVWLFIPVVMEARNCLQCFAVMSGCLLWRKLYGLHLLVIWSCLCLFICYISFCLD
jgi:hypothetical protein